MRPGAGSAAASLRVRRAPLLLGLLALVTVAAAALPLAYLVIRVASGGSGAWRLIDASSTFRLVLDTLLLVGGVVGAGLVIGVPLAWLVVRTDLPGRRALAVLAALPLVIPSYVAALALLGALGPRGLLQEILEEPLGIERLPEIYGYPGALLALTLSTYPYVFLLVASALRSLDPSLEEAARLLGRSRAAVFWRMTVPALRPPILAGSLLVALYTLSDFGAVSLMRYPTLTRSIYLRYETLFDRTSAAALALVLVAMTAVLLALESRFRGSASYYRSAPGAARQPSAIRLGHWRWPAAVLGFGVVSIFLLLPLAVLGYWVAQAAPLGSPIDVAWHAGRNAVLVSAVAAALAVVGALPIAFLSQRHPALWTRTLERLSYASNALPGIVIALSLVYFGARYATFAYQTLSLLVFAYVVRFLPQALAPVGSSLGMVSPRIEEAARGLGRRPLAVLVTITARLARPGLLAGGALVFLSAMKELPATLLLRPIGFDTLATEIWTATSIGAYSEAAPAALLLVVLAGPFVYLLAARRAWEIGAPG